MKKLKLPEFDREKIFAEVDESSKRFEKYTREERNQLLKEARKIIEEGRKEFLKEVVDSKKRKV